MPGTTNPGMQCSEFDALLSDALDSKLSDVQRQRFQAHATACPLCGPLFADAEAGRLWLQGLEEVEPPANLMHNILAQTVGIEAARRAGAHMTQPSQTWTDRLRDGLGRYLAPVFGVIRQPRFAMSFGMAFFSLSIALSVTGVKASDLKQVNLRPSAIKRTYYSTTGKVVKYYENIRFVYEIESRVRDFKKATTPAEPGPETKPDNNRKNNTSGEPDQRQDRNYSQGENQVILASSPEDPTVVMVTTNRRFV